MVQICLVFTNILFVFIAVCIFDLLQCVFQARFVKIEIVDPN